MRPLKMIAVGLLAWPAAEIAAFILVATLLGTSAALLLLVLVSFAGLMVLRHFGGGATQLRAATTLDETKIAPRVGGILLVIPGFIAGLLGLLVLFPISRRWLLAWCQYLLAVPRQPASSEIIDLAPNEWRTLPNPKLPP